MVVDNFDIIGGYITPDGIDTFYFLQIVQRKKDGNEMSKGNNGARLIKAYYIKSIEQLYEKKAEIVKLCEHNNARAYIHLNERSFFKVCCGVQKKISDMLMENNCYQAPRVWDHVCGELPAKSGKHLLRLCDVDTKDEEKLEVITRCIAKCRGNDDYFNRIKIIIPTLNGFHLITSKFDVEQCQQELAINGLDSIDIHRDSPTLLYYKND